MTNKVMLTMESRIHGDMYVRFGGRLAETYHRKVAKRCGPSLLKELGELAEINEPVRETYYKGNERIDEITPKYALLSTHAGRRTFICNALALGIPAQVVMKWTGHSDYKAMKPYIDIADDIRANAMNKFNQL